eukprot:7605288-Karenia_brevis.AAC.1
MPRRCSDMQSTMHPSSLTEGAQAAHDWQLRVLQPPRSLLQPKGARTENHVDRGDIQTWWQVPAEELAQPSVSAIRMQQLRDRVLAQVRAQSPEEQPGWGMPGAERSCTDRMHPEGVDVASAFVCTGGVAPKA